MAIRANRFADKNILPALLQEHVGVFFFGFYFTSMGNKIGGKFADFCGIFRTHKIKAQNFQGKNGSIFVGKVVSRKTKTILANFVLQTLQSEKPMSTSCERFARIASNSRFAFSRPPKYDSQ